MWMRFYFLAAFRGVLQYEEIYFNAQFANNFPKKDLGIFFSRLIGTGVD